MPRLGDLADCFCVDVEETYIRVLLILSRLGELKPLVPNRKPSFGYPGSISGRFSLKLLVVLLYLIVGD